MSSHLPRGAIVTVLAGACCLAFAATIVIATRAGPGSPRRAGAPVVVDSPHDARAARALAAAVRITPASGTTDLAPGAPVVVQTRAGRLTKVRVIASTGAVIAGSSSSTHKTWRSTDALAYGTSYRVAATVAGSNRAHAELLSTFRTLAPATIVTASVFPSEGLAVGVGQPIVIRFDHYISSAVARAAVVSHLNVLESEPVLGGWHWFSNNELHFRPQSYWPPNDKITIAWDLRGWNAGDGMWGDGDGSVNFSIGNARVSYANLETHRMTVTENGRIVAVYPISGGKPTDPTMNGVHLVLDRSSVVRMNSATNGVPAGSPDSYDELVFWDVHISDSGEYVHAAPWSTSSQGVQNVSHGCINLSVANAQAFFAFSRVGDIVLVGGGPRPPEAGDHGVIDWDTAWNEFMPANAILHVPSGISFVH
jgi:lipoprotein-anchoring transpeptidase ErfK/SrfK